MSNTRQKGDGVGGQAAQTAPCVGRGTVRRQLHLASSWLQQPPLEPSWQQQPPLASSWQQQPPLEPSFGRQQPPLASSWQQQPPLEPSPLQQPKKSRHKSRHTEGAGAGAGSALRGSFCSSCDKSAALILSFGSMAQQRCG